MTARRPPARYRRGDLLTELSQGLRPVARPNVLVLLWRWRYEVGLSAGLPAAFGFLVAWLGWVWSLGGIAAVVAVLANWPGARRWLRDHARCVITAHRVRAGCVQAWIQTRYGKLPVILLTSPRPYGEQVHIWCRAGICPEDFESATDILCAACWASDIRVSRSPRYAHIVVLDIIRSELLD